MMISLNKLKSVGFGLVAYALVGKLGLYLLLISWRDYATHNTDKSYTLSMLFARLLVGLLAATTASISATKLANDSAKSAWVVGSLVLEGVGELRKVESRVNFVATKQQSDDQTVLKTDRPSMGSNFAFFQSQTKAQTRFTSSNEHHFVALANRMSMA